MCNKQRTECRLKAYKTPKKLQKLKKVTFNAKLNEIHNSDQKVGFDTK